MSFTCATAPEIAGLDAEHFVRPPEISVDRGPPPAETAVPDVVVPNMTIGRKKRYKFEYDIRIQVRFLLALLSTLAPLT